jgi:CspA family cold shock protein
MNRGSDRFIDLFVRSAPWRRTVKWFNAKKGFGFIQPDAGGGDVFVYIIAVERAGLRDLHEGQKIGYEVVADRGLAALQRKLALSGVSKRRRGMAAIDPTAWVCSNPPR